MSTAARRADWPWLITLCGIALLVRVYGIDTYALDLDEATSIDMASRELSRLRYVGVHPPLYYLSLRAWLALGDDEVVVRSLSTLFSVMTVPFVYLLGRAVAGRGVGLVAAVLFVVSPLQIREAQNARMYALLTLSAVLAMWGLARVLPRVEDARSGPTARAWLPYLLGCTLALYTHNAAILLVLACSVVVLSTAPSAADPSRVFRSWLIVHAAVGVLMLPWLRRMLAQYRRVLDTFWIPAPDPERIVAVLQALYVGGPVHGLAAFVAVSIATLALLGAWSLRRSPERLLLPAALLGLPILAALLISVVRPIFAPRTLVWTTVPLSLLVAAGIVALRPRALRPAALATIAAMQLLGLVGYRADIPIEDWDRAASQVAEHADARDRVVLAAGYTIAPFGYYYRRFQGSAPLLPAGTGFITDEVVRTVVAQLEGAERVWLVYSHEGYADADGRMLGALRTLGTEIESHQFARIDVYLFDTTP